MNNINFEIPANDLQLTSQVFSHISNHEKEVDMSELLTNIGKKYRFAGYIGSIDYIFFELLKLKEDLEKAKMEIENLKKKKKTWFF